MNPSSGKDWKGNAMSEEFFDGKESIGGEIRKKLATMKSILQDSGVLATLNTSQFVITVMDDINQISYLPELNRPPIFSPQFKHMKYNHRNKKESRK